MANFGTFNDGNESDNVTLVDGTDPTRKNKVSITGDASVSDGLKAGGINARLTLTLANTAYEAKVGVSRLSLRKSLTITANNNMFWGYSNTVTSITGTPLKKGQQIVFAIDPDAASFQVWLVSTTAASAAQITESP